MPLYKKRNVSKNKTYKKRTYKKSLRPTMQKQVSAIVKNVLHKTAEDKIVIDEIFNKAPIEGSGCDWDGITATATNGLIYLSVGNTGFLPTIKSGTAESQRVANKVQPRRLSIRGTIQTTAGTTGQSPFYVHMFIYHRKGNIFNGDTLQLLENAGGGLPFDGTLQRSLYPINRNSYTIIKHKVFKMQIAYSFAVTPNTSSDGWGNGFKMSHTFNIPLPVNATWKYNDGLTDTPTNQNYYVFFATVNADDTINPVAPLSARATVNMQSVLYYEDV